jgi:hypothetical protein
MSYTDKVKEKARKNNTKGSDERECETAAPTLPLHVIEAFIASLTNNMEGEDLHVMVHALQCLLT